jgi:glutamine synthetase
VINGAAKSVRAELRCPDPSCNPYLAYTVMLSAALDGINRNLQAPEPWKNLNVYELDPKQKEKLNILELPGSLREALLEMDKDPLIRDALGDVIYEAFKRAKWAEWEDYRLKVMDWEVEKYLETA